ncbi:hypothetical protein DUNSADRAFT_17409 [Dunaliella salina]|uniref:Encoded protein n=1 Tax=Dunaliella salina TaxID=3046 RepID=A0ABQ7G1T3_DUNSA|nr:hypothetical protein DUNSADRAFT_17409 [Dunaliella salina]|eukprot:KAF5828567.1 hypothetical protein DUNSADRAFT_17409 [Dunaliella salina]
MEAPPHLHSNSRRRPCCATLCKQLRWRQTRHLLWRCRCKQTGQLLRRCRWRQSKHVRSSRRSASI